MNFFKILLYIYVFLGFKENLVAQFSSAIIHVNGLTCSLCSAGIENALYKLDFVSEVQMDLNRNVAHVTFHHNKSVQLKAVVAQIRDAGFSVSKLKAQYLFKEQQVKEGSIFLYGGYEYRFIKIDQTLLDGPTLIELVSKETLTRKEFKQYQRKLRLYTEELNGNTDKTYFVTL